MRGFNERYVNIRFRVVILVVIVLKNKWKYNNEIIVFVLFIIMPTQVQRLDTSDMIHIGVIDSDNFERGIMFSIFYCNMLHIYYYISPAIIIIITH